MAFVTSFVPGIVMASIFGQLQLLAAPLLAIPSEYGFGDAYDKTKLVEQLVLHLPGQAPEWEDVDPRIQSEKVLDGLYVLTVPTFKPLKKSSAD